MIKIINQILKGVIHKKVAFMIILLIFYFPRIILSQYLNPGDGIRLIFFNNPDNVSGDYFVQKDLTIQLPFIGFIETKDRLIDSVRIEIFYKYESIYRNLELTVLPLYKINVLGEVNAPGVYYVTGVEKLSDLLAKAGGETGDANLKKLYLVSDGRKSNINAKQILEKGSKLNDLGLKSGDQIYVPRKWISYRNTYAIISGLAVIVTIISIIYK
ncbi:MAG: polysaccharide biosynthesis/export family protein [Candidatus Hodarchaeota archaeon]